MHLSHNAAPRLARFIRLLAAAALLAGVFTQTVLAHEVTYKGTVLAVEKDKVRVNVVDAKTRKTAPMTFDVDADTKVYRGTTLVKFADARIAKDETIAVTVNLDDDKTLANEIKLGAK